MSNLSYAIIGTGALGGFYGANLAHSGRDVHFLLRSDFEHVKRHGLVYESPKGNFTLPGAKAYRSPSDLPRCDVVCVCIKTTQNDQLPALLPPAVHPGCAVLVMQNGLGMEQDVAELVPDCRVIGVQCYLCSHKVGPGHIRHLDYGWVTMGAYGEADPERMDTIAADFETAGIPATVTNNLDTARWQKLVWNIPYNGLTVALDAPTDVIMATPASRDLTRRLMLEVLEGAHACGHDIAESYVDEMMGFTDKMESYFPSMKLDYDAGVPLEIETMYRKPLEKARAAGADLPLIGMLCDLLTFLDERSRDRPVPKR